MNNTDIFTLGLNLQAPWNLVSQHLDTKVSPFELHLEVATARGTLFPCPECGKACPAHDFKEQRWRHLNFFQHHCYITARVPRVKCTAHKVKQVQVPWARPGSGFTLLFEQAALTLVREMPVNAAARIMEVTDKRLWRMIDHYVRKSLLKLDLTDLRAIGFDETAAKRGHKYVTVFIDMNKAEMPVIFARPGKGKDTVKSFKTFAQEHNADTSKLAEVVCDMSPAFQSAIKKQFPQANITVDWFHVCSYLRMQLTRYERASVENLKCQKDFAGQYLKIRMVT